LRISPTASSRLQALSRHLGLRREELLRRWREAVRHDPELATNASLTRGALNDHIPRILEDFERRLATDHSLGAPQTDPQQRQDAADHGMHRWQQGYDIRETLREWGHLHAVILQELECYAVQHPELEPEVMPAARAMLAALCMDGNCESAARHVRLQQAEAAGRVRDLEASLAALQSLENERATLVRETAHDLRGSVSVIANTTALLAEPAVRQDERDRFSGLLQQRIHSMGALLGDLVELSRLEAGQDPLSIDAFDAAERIREQCEILRPLATERNLFLKCEGPQALPVEGDALKVQRILQNLLLNALKATQRGGVIVHWAVDGGQSTRQWTLSVSDSGPGLDPGSAGPLRRALKAATKSAHEVTSEDATLETSESESLELQSSRSTGDPTALPSGEGIGLSIVKRLCELLGATVELETAPAHGTTFRISFPLRYSPTSSGDRGSKDSRG
jgi:signal transduction histidine kinase